jgi:hypothetical protein
LVKYIKCPLIWTVMRVSSVPSIAENQTNGEWKAEGAIPQVKKTSQDRYPRRTWGFFHFCFLRRGLFTGVLNHNPRRSWEGSRSPNFWVFPVPSGQRTLVFFFFGLHFVVLHSMDQKVLLSRVWSVFCCGWCSLLQWQRKKFVPEDVGLSPGFRFTNYTKLKGWGREPSFFSFGLCSLRWNFRL